MLNCDHQFVVVDAQTKSGVVAVVCAHCGQVRRVFESGRVEVIKKQGTVRFLDKSDEVERD